MNRISLVASPVCFVILILFSLTQLSVFADHECQPARDAYRTAVEEYNWASAKHAAAVGALSAMLWAISYENFDPETMMDKPMTPTQKATVAALVVAVAITGAEKSAAETTKGEKLQNLTDCNKLAQRKCGCWINHTGNLTSPCGCSWATWNHWCHCPYTYSSGSGSGR